MRNELINPILESTISKLVSTRLSEEGTVITLPTVYTSGAPVQVRINFDGNTYFVNDMGMALQEAELMGATPRLFSNQAKSIAEKNGILFDNHSFFAVHVDESRLSGAIKIVGSASLNAVVSTENRLAEQIDTSARNEFVEKILETFGRTKVTREVEFLGSSTHNWKFAARVEHEDGTLLFDTASTAPASVYSSHAKFSDLRRLEHPPKGVIGITDYQLFKPDYKILLQQVANVVDAQANVDTLAYLKVA